METFSKLLWDWVAHFPTILAGELDSKMKGGKWRKFAYLWKRGGGLGRVIWPRAAAFFPTKCRIISSEGEKWSIDKIGHFPFIFLYLRESIISIFVEKIFSQLKIFKYIYFLQLFFNNLI